VARSLSLAGIAFVSALTVGAAFADDDPPFEEATPAAPAEPAPATPGDAKTAADKDSTDYPRCVVTKERWDTSSTRVEAIFRVDGRRLRAKFLSLPYMLIEYKLLEEDNHEVEIESVSVLDFPSFGSGSERMIPINEEWDNIAFLSTDSQLQGTKRPYYAAFSDPTELEQFQKQLGGKAMTYEGVLKKLLRALKDDDVKAAESWEDSMRRTYKQQESAMGE
jgi:hypothetical protein